MKTAVANISNYQKHNLTNRTSNSRHFCDDVLFHPCFYLLAAKCLCSSHLDAIDKDVGKQAVIVTVIEEEQQEPVADGEQR